MNRRNIIGSAISALIYIFQTRLGAANEIIEPIDAYFNKPDLVMNNTAIITDPVFLEHHIAPNHPETPERIGHIQKAISESNLSEIIERINPAIDISENTSLVSIIATGIMLSINF